MLQVNLNQTEPIKQLLTRITALADLSFVSQGLTTLSLYLYKEAKQNQIKIIVEHDRTLEDIGITDKLNLAVQEVLTTKGKQRL